MRLPIVFRLVAAWTLMATAPALASFSATDVFLPSVGRGAGAAGSQWYTTLWIHNPGTSAANVQIAFLLRDQANPSPSVYNLTVQAGDTERVVDAITTLFGATGFGALRVTSNQKVLVNSRIYSMKSGQTERNSVGQFFAGVPSSFALAAGQSASLLGVYQTSPVANSEFRYNFGFVECTGGSASVRVTAYDPTGASLGSKDYSLRGFEPRQFNITDLLPTINQTNVRLQVQVLSGPGKVIAFGSGLANESSDPSTFEMSFRDELLGAGGGLAAVQHDSTLVGDGTAAAPLGLANGAVTQAKLAAGGTASSGKVLGTDGSSLVWQSAGSGGFTLPYDGTAAATTAPAFSATNSAGSTAVRGLATNAAGTVNYGGYFEAYGSSGRGVAGAVNGASGWGVYGLALGAAGKGVVGESAHGDGVMGSSAAATKSGVYGVNSVEGGYGIFGRNSSSGSVGYLGGFHGVWGVTGAGLAHAGYFEASGNLAAGVYGKSTNAYGYGGVFEATGSNGFGLLAVGPAAGSPGAAAIFRGNVQVQSRSTGAVLIELGEGLDLSEGFDVAGGEEVGPGSVVVIDPTHPGRLALSRAPYDRAVAGIVAGANNLGSAVRIGAGGFDRDIALAGRVYCNVDATYGEVRVGDLLTTSPTPGFAMVARDRQRAYGAVIGKAMEALPQGQRGQILVLVALQ